MKHFLKYLLACMLFPAAGFGMETKTKNYKLPSFLQMKLDEARCSGILNLDATRMLDWELPKRPIGCQALAEALGSLPMVRMANMRGLILQLPIDGLSEVTQAVGALPALRNLDLSFNILSQMQDEHIAAIVDMIRRVRHLDSIDFYGSNLNKYLCSAIKCLIGKRIAYLGLKNCSLSAVDEHIQREFLAELGAMAHGLDELDLTDNNLFCVGSVWNQLGPAIRELRKLNLSSNIRDVGQAMNFTAWKAFTRALVVSDIENLDLSYNWLNRVDIRVWRLLVNAFAYMKKLKILDLRGNHLGRKLKRCTVLVTSLMRNRNRLTLIINVSDDPVIESSEGPVGFWANMRDRGLLNVRIV